MSERVPSSFHAILSASLRFSILIVPLVAFPCLAGNSIFIKHARGPQQPDRPFTIFRVFVQGEVANYPRPRIGETPLPAWQTNVQTRWPDGSVQQAYISFTVDMTKGHTIPVDFVNDPNPCHLGNQAVCDGAAPTQDQILNFNAGNWGADIETADGGVVQSASARAMVQNGDWRFWIKGPLANVIIAEDRTPTVKYDFGWHCESGCAKPGVNNRFLDYKESSWTADTANRSLHPIFVLTQYKGWPGVKVEYILENDWMSTVQDQRYDLTLKSAKDLTKVEFSRPGMVQIRNSRWRKTFWDGREPGDAHIDFNTPYMIATHALPTYDMTRSLPEAAVDEEIHRWRTGDQADIASVAPLYAGTVYKLFPATGARPDIGLLPKWDALYLYSMNPTLYQEVIGDAEAMGYAPNHYRESTAHRFYDDRHTVDAFGRTVSADARPGFMSRDVLDKGLSYAADQPTVVGGISDNYWNSMDVAHQPDPTYLAYLLTGDWYLLEEMYFWASYDLTAATPGGLASCRWCRHDSWAFMNDSLGNTRGIAWQTRTVAHAAWAAPDGSPEKAYFTQKLNYNFAAREGIMHITDGNFTGDPRWTWGWDVLVGHRPDPLGWVGISAGAPTVQATDTVDPTKACNLEAIWQQNYVNVSWGHVEELGFTGVSALRRTAAKNLLHMILDPDYAPKYLLDVYYLGTRGRAANCRDAQPFTNWQEVLGSVTQHAYKGAENGWAHGAVDATGGYPTIMLAAGSFLPGIDDGNERGIDAWCYLKHHVVNQSSLSNNPMWAFVPRMPAGDREHGKERDECK